MHDFEDVKKAHKEYLLKVQEAYCKYAETVKNLDLLDSTLEEKMFKKFSFRSLKDIDNAA